MWSPSICIPTKTSERRGYSIVPSTRCSGCRISFRCIVRSLLRPTHIINKMSLSMMKKGVMLINTSRGKLIDTDAAIAALKEGRLGYLGIDVYEQEEKLFFKDLSRNDYPRRQDLASDDFPQCSDYIASGLLHRCGPSLIFHRPLFRTSPTFSMAPTNPQNQVSVEVIH